MRPGVTPFALLFCLVALGACQGRKHADAGATGPEWADTCPLLAQFTTRNPVADATAAHRRHDNRLMMLGGLAGEIPGSAPGELSIADEDAAVMLPETIDDGGCPSKDALNMARNYAYRYNQVILTTVRADQGARPVSAPTERRTA
jgi:hypothetical protein